MTEIIDLIKRVLGDNLEPVEEQLITLEESKEFGRLDAMLGTRREEFYALFKESEASKTYSFLHWHSYRFVGDYRTQYLLRQAEYVANIRAFRAMKDELKKFLEYEQ